MALANKDQKGNENEKGKISLRGMRQKQEEQQREELIETGMTETELREKKLKEMEEQRKLEDARKPKSETQKKVSNFFYHYRIHVIIGVFALLFVALFVKDLFFTPKEDLSIVIAADRPVPHDFTEELTGIITPLVGDLNGDGHEIVLTDAVQIPTDKPPVDQETGAIQSDPTMEAAGMMKLMAVISAGDDHLFFLDKAAYRYITQNDGGDLFVPLDPEDDSVRSLPFDETILTDIEHAWYFEDFAFYVRIPQKADKPTEDYYASLKLIESLRAEETE